MHATRVCEQHYSKSKNDGNLKTIAFPIRRLKDTEKRHATGELELLGLVCAFETFEVLYIRKTDKITYLSPSLQSLLKKKTRETYSAIANQMVTPNIPLW